MADEIVQSFSLDGAEMIKGLAEIRESMIQIGKVSGLTEKQIQEAMQKGYEESRKYEKAINDVIEANKDLITSTNKVDKATDAYEDASKKVDDLADKTDQAGKAANRARDEFGRFTKAAGETDKVAGSLGKLGSIAKMAGGFIAGMFAVDKIMQFGQAVYQSITQFQKFEAMLKTALGSKSEARAALASLSDFAKKTPFELNELTDAYIKFANRGVKLTKEELTKLGDLASSQGKSFLQLTEAVLDAGTGEFERLKEFGIKASANGEKVSLTFKNQTVEVKRNEQAIRDAVIAMGAYNGIAGGMAEQTATIGGKASNAADSMSQMATAIGQRLAPAIADGLDGIISLFDGITSLVKTKSVEELTSDFNAQIDTFTDLNSKLTPLADRYDELKGKVNLTSKEQGELKSITNQLAAEVPMAISAWDEYGNAISVSTDAVRNFIAEQKALLLYTNKSEIERIKGELSELEAQAKVLRNAISSDQQTLSKGQNFRGRDLFENEIKALQGRVVANNEKLQEVSLNIRGAQARLEQLNGDFIDKRKKQLDEEKKLAAEERKKQQEEAEAREKAANAEKDAKKRQAEAEKAEKERLQAIREHIALENELAMARIELMAAGKEKEIAIENQRSANDIQQLNFRLLTAKKGSEEEKALHELIVLEKKGHVQALLDIEQKYTAESIRLQEEGSQRLQEAYLNGKDLELAQLNAAYAKQAKEINEKYKNDYGTRIALITALGQELGEKQVAISHKYAMKELEDSEKTDILLAETTIKNEEARMVAVLRIRLQYAKLKLDLLKDEGKASNSVEVLQAEKLIQDLEAQLNEAVGKLQSKDINIRKEIFEAIGLGDLSDDEQQLIVDSLSDLYANVMQGLTDQIDAQIAEKQRMVDALTEQVDQVEAELDREKELQEQGYANNVSIKEKELAALKAQREKALREEEAAQKKKQQLQKAQMIVDSIQQTVNLITASTKIFDSLASIPFVGVPLAIGLIAAMFGGFAYAKAQAFKATNAQQFEDGGLIGGKRHASGGNKYRSMDGNDPSIVEIEKGEFITNRESTNKYLPLLEAINSDALSQWTFADLQRFVDPGARMREDLPKESRGLAAQVNVINAGMNDPQIRKELSSINNGIQSLLDHEKSKAEVTDMGDHIIIKSGSVTRRIKK